MTNIYFINILFKIWDNQRVPLFNCFANVSSFEKLNLKVMNRLRIQLKSHNRLKDLK